MEKRNENGEEPDEPGEKDCEGGHCDIQTKSPGTGTVAILHLNRHPEFLGSDY
jgi:hypothetical protein